MGPPQMHLAAMLVLLDALLFYWDFKTTFVRWYGKFLRLLLGPLIIGETDSLPNPPSKDATKPPQILPSKKLQYPTRLWNAKIFLCLFAAGDIKCVDRWNGKISQGWVSCWIDSFIWSAELGATLTHQKAFTCCTSTNLSHKGRRGLASSLSKYWKMLFKGHNFIYLVCISVWVGE